MYYVVNFHEIEAYILCDYIEDKLHASLRLQAALIQKYLRQDLYCVCNCTTQFSLIQVLFQRLEEEMEQVFRKESIVLFPLIREQVEGNGLKKINENAFEILKESHNKMIQIAQKLRQLTNNYFVKSGWNAPAKLCVNELFDFEQALQRWIHLEEGVLFPKLDSDFLQEKPHQTEDEWV